MELLQVIHRQLPEGEEVDVSVMTHSDQARCTEQDESFRKMEESFMGTGLNFSYKYDSKETSHDRYISTDTGWKIILGRGLDIFQRYDMNAFSIENHTQNDRRCKEFSITYLKGSI